MKKAIVDNKRLKKKLDNATSESGIIVDSQLEKDVLSFISINNDKANEFEVGAQDEFKKIFWEQQVHCVHCTSNYVCIILRLYTSLGHSYYVDPSSFLAIGGAKLGPNRARPRLVSVPWHATPHTCL